MTEAGRVTRPMNIKTMRPRSPYPPQTPAERQAKCRAIKRGEWHTCEVLEKTVPPALMPPTGRPTAALMGPPTEGIPAAALPAPTNRTPALPAPATGTAIQKALSADLTALAKPDADGAGAELRLSLPPAVAARLRSLLDRHEGLAGAGAGAGAGKPLTAAERDEAQGLLDIAEYFVVQRLRNRVAA